jgi:CheY-like chemotaxis protein
MNGSTDGDKARPKTPTKPRRLLIVEDHDDSAEFLAEMFTLAGYEVRLAKDGPSALEIASTFLPEVCLLDIGLPCIDGYEVAKRLRLQGHPLGAAPQLIAVSGYGRAADFTRSRDAGFRAHLLKPVVYDELVKAVAEA